LSIYDEAVISRSWIQTDRWGRRWNPHHSPLRTHRGHQAPWPSGEHQWIYSKNFCRHLPICMRTEYYFRFI